MPSIRFVWTVNPITLAPIVGAIIVGVVWKTTVDNDLSDLKTFRAARSVFVDKQISSILDVIRDVPYRMDQQEKATAAQLEKDKAQDARIDRQTDLILSGQDSMRTTMQAGFDAVRKDMGTLSTKVEVIGSKVDMAASKTIPRS
ncbi:hypothetical protein [Rhizobium tumorigenes]|uniref:hypothetical protein n=1 Tax=Rhizobium tumorigenes TaxID=2041385 RepID=UPI00241EBE0C|nr:hypothetical protein [Rhizobium tumorigenes]WFS02226.1 hypothetical protein PR016_06325 [Rhizobium tumorigenes]